jgi:plasmid stability protein
MKPAMAQLIVRGIDEAIVKALRERAARNGRSAEAEHRAILEAELRGPKRRTFAEALMAMPNAGRDEDFARIDEPVKARRRRVPG